MLVFALVERFGSPSKIALVEEETRRYRPTKNYLDYLPAPNYSSFETEMMKSEFERLQVVYNISNHDQKIRKNCNIQTFSTWISCMTTDPAP